MYARKDILKYILRKSRHVLRMGYLANCLLTSLSASPGGGWVWSGSVCRGVGIVSAPLRGEDPCHSFCGLCGGIIWGTRGPAALAQFM